MTGQELLRACLHLRQNPAATEALRLRSVALADSWESVQVTAEHERVAPLLHHTIGNLGIMPPEVAKRLHQTYRLTGIHNLILLREVGPCLRALAGAGVPVIVLKGAALAEPVYRNLALRPMMDVDLLIMRHDLSTARRVLKELGYAPQRTETHPGVLEEHENELAFCKPGTVPVFLDVHWSLFDSPYYQRRIAMDWFWETAQSGSIAGVPVQMLGPAALIIHLCGHLALHHTATGLLWWHDIAEVLAFYQGKIDWPELVSRTQQYGLVLPVREVLTQLAKGWNVPVPVEVLSKLQSLQPSAEEQRIFKLLSAVQRPSGQRFWADLTSMTDWRQRLRFARTNLFPSVQYMRRRYQIRSPLLVPLYYPYRWLRGLLGRPEQ